MEQGKLKYRIVGGIVLLALAAILVPLLGGVRQPLPQGPQPIDIPAEPADGAAAQLPDGDAQLKGDVPEPQDIPAPLPAPPLAQEGDDAAADAAPEDDHPPVHVPPVARPAPASPPRMAPPAPKAAPVKPETSAAVKPAAPAVPVAPPAATKPAPAPKPVAAPPAPVNATPKPPAVAAVRPPKPAAPVTNEPPAPAKPAVAPPTAQQAWVVQLGVYGNLKTAIDLRESLRKAGHSAFTEEVATPQGKALRVRVGPELDRAKAQALRDRLARETAHDGIVVAYP
jgi:DedD protein